MRSGLDAHVAQLATVALKLADCKALATAISLGKPLVAVCAISLASRYFFAIASEASRSFCVGSGAGGMPPSAAMRSSASPTCWRTVGP